MTPSPSGPVGLATAVAREGQVVSSSTAGLRDPSGTPVTHDTVFQVASLTKPVTALTVLRLVQAGRLSLDRDVNTYLSDCEVLASSGQPVTIRQLLAHTGGLGIVRHRRDLLMPWVVLGETRTHARTPRDLYGARLRTIADPDTAWSYGSHGFGVVQRVVEDVTRRSFVDVARAEVLQPLGLAHSTFADTPPADRPVARGCRRRDDHRVRWYRHRVFSPLAGGGLWASAWDLARLGAAVVVPGDDAWLVPELRGELFRPQPYAGAVNPYQGLGLRLGSCAEPARASHGGRWWGSFGHLLVDPDQRVTVVVLATGRPAIDRANRLLRDVLAAPVGRRPPGPVAADRSLTGTYRTRAPVLGALTAYLAFGGELRIVARPRELRVFSGWGDLRHGAALRPLGDGRYSFLAGGSRRELCVVPTSCGPTVFVAAPMCCFTRVAPHDRPPRWVRAAAVLARRCGAIRERWLRRRRRRWRRRTRLRTPGTRRARSRAPA